MYKQTVNPINSHAAAGVYTVNTSNSWKTARYRLSGILCSLCGSWFSLGNSHVSLLKVSLLTAFTSPGERQSVIHNRKRLKLCFVNNSEWSGKPKGYVAQSVVLYGSTRHTFTTAVACNYTAEECGKLNRNLRDGWQRKNGTRMLAMVLLFPQQAFFHGCLLQLSLFNFPAVFIC